MRIASRSLAAVAVIALSASLTPSIGSVAATYDGGSTWVSPDILAEGAPVKEPTMVRDPRSGLHATWLAFDGEHWRVQASDRAYGRAWSTPRFLSPAGHDASEPRVAANAGTHGVVVAAAWLLEKTGTSIVQAAVRPPGSTVWQPPLDVSTAASADPQIAVDGVDDAFGEARPQVFWLDHGGTHWRARMASLSSSGDHVDARRGISNGATDAADLAVTNDGAQYYVSWTRFDGGNWRAEWKRGGNLEAAQPEVLDIAGEDMRTPLVGFFGVAWTSEHAEGIWVRAVTRTWGAHPWGPAVTLSDVAHDATDLSMPVDDEQSLVLVWAEHEGVASTVMAATADPSDSIWEPTFPVSTSGAHADHPATAGSSAAWVETVGGRDLIAYAAHEQAGWTPPVHLSPTDVDASSPSVTGAGGSSTSYLGPGVIWVEGTGSAATVVVRGLDVAAPSTTMLRPLPLRTDGSAAVGWQVRDDWSAITAVEALYSVRSWSEPPSTSQTVELPLPPSARGTQVAIEPGHRYCFSARATDAVSRVGPWARPQCVSAPFDDRQLTRGAGWEARHGAAFYEGTYLRTTQRGRHLEVPVSHARTIALVGTTGAGQGVVRVTYRGHSVKVDLARGVKGQSTIRRVFTSAWVRSGTVRITVLSRGLPVQVDGLAVW